MSYTITMNNNHIATFQFKVSSDDFSHELEKEIFRSKDKMNVNVYRNGKIPPEVMQQVYNRDELLKRVMNTIIGKEYDDALNESKIQPLTMPSATITNCKKGEPFTFTIEVTTMPEIQIESYFGIEVAKPQFEVLDEELETVVQKMLHDHKKTVEVTDRPALEGDLVYIDFEGFLHGRAFKGNKAEKFPLVIGSHSFIPGFEEQIIGVSINEAKDFNITYPQDYRIEELAGKEVVFRCIVRRITKVEIPELNDEFVKAYTNYDTVLTYKDNLRKSMSVQKHMFELKKKENFLMKTIVENSEIIVPDTLLQLEKKRIEKEQANELKKRNITLEKHLKALNVTPQKYEEQLLHLASKRTKTKLALLAIANKEKIEISEAELQTEIARIINVTKQPEANFTHSFTRGQLIIDLKIRKALQLVMKEAVEI